jgi:probable F420-dependent oxidoreductase
MEHHMKLGSMIFAGRGSMDIVDFARVSEDCGFESIWQADHSHRPITEEERQGWEDWTLPLHARGHGTIPDLWVILGAWAAATTEVKIGTAITLVMQRDPIQLAHEVATADVLSNGRVLFGVGFGHPKPPYTLEMLNHGTDPRQRFGVLRERVLAMKEIWTQDEAEFHGKYVNFDPIWAEPKPVQRPHPPVLLGSSGGPTQETWERRIGWLLEYCDSWLPMIREPHLAERIAELQSRAADAGRSPLGITLLWPNEVKTLEERHLDEYAGIGVDRIIFFPPWGPAEELVPQLKSYGALAPKYA